MNGRKESMARAKYHNLEGLIRDINRCFHDGEYDLIGNLCDLLDDFEDARVGIAEDTAGEGPDAGLGLPDQLDLPGLGGPTPGHDSVRAQDLDIAARLEHAVERITQLESSRGRVPSDTAHLASAIDRHSLVVETRETKSPKIGP